MSKEKSYNLIGTPCMSASVKLDDISGNTLVSYWYRYDMEGKSCICISIYGQGWSPEYWDPAQLKTSQSKCSESQTLAEDIQIPCNVCIYIATCEEDLNWHKDYDHDIQTDLYFETDFSL